MSEEKLPVSPKIEVLDYETLSKSEGWWSAVVKAVSFGRTKISLYLWRKKDGVWKRKQKFTIPLQQWQKIKKVVDQFIAGQ